MTRFDEPAADSRATWGDACALVAAQPAVFLITIAVGFSALVLALGALALGQGLSAQVGLAIGRTQASVVLAPQVARSDAEALRGRIETMPTIARAALKTREEALAALAGDGLPALANKPNPLPDVWIVTLQPVAGSVRPPSVDVSAAKDALAALPGVASVAIDDRWIATLDRWASLAARVVAATNVLVFGALAGLLLCVGFVAGRAGARLREGGVGIGAFATIGLLAGVVSVLLALAAVWGVTTWIATSGMDPQAMLESTGRTLAQLAVAACAVALFAPLIGMSAGAARR